LVIFFLCISQQGVSADIIQNSAVGNFSSKPNPKNPKTEGQEQLGADELVTLPHKFGSLKI
jgi:hypothetical protein